MPNALVLTSLCNLQRIFYWTSLKVLFFFALELKFAVNNTCSCSYAIYVILWLICVVLQCHCTVTIRKALFAWTYKKRTAEQNNSLKRETAPCRCLCVAPVSLPLLRNSCRPEVDKHKAMLRHIVQHSHTQFKFFNTEICPRSTKVDKRSIYVI